MAERKSSLRVWLGTLFLFLPFAAVSGHSAGTVNVLRVGDGQAYATIQAAVNVAGPGDMVLVYPGTSWSPSASPARPSRSSHRTRESS